MSRIERTIQEIMRRDMRVVSDGVVRRLVMAWRLKRGLGIAKPPLAERQEVPVPLVRNPFAFAKPPPAYVNGCRNLPDTMKIITESLNRKELQDKETDENSKKRKNQGTLFGIGRKEVVCIDFMLLQYEISRALCLRIMRAQLKSGSREGIMEVKINALLAV